MLLEILCSLIAVLECIGSENPVQSPHPLFLINPSQTQIQKDPHRSQPLQDHGRPIRSHEEILKDISILGTEFLNSSEPASIDTTIKVLEYLRELNASANQLSKHNSNNSLPCSEIYDGIDFYIRSPNYPQNYPAYTSCWYEIQQRRRTICGVKLTLLRFDVGRQEDSSDSVIGNHGCTDQLSTEDQILCGRYEREREAFLNFTSPSLMLHFQSGEGYGSPGFLIKGHQSSECGSSQNFGLPMKSSVNCDKVYTGTESLLISPGFPNKYMENMDCLYTIIRQTPEICGLMVTPIEFYVEGPSFCIFDFVEIGGQRLCGNLTNAEPLYYMFEKDEVKIRFRSDENVEDMGFQIKVRQISCEELKYFQPVNAIVTESRSANSESNDLSNRQSKESTVFSGIEDTGTILSMLAKTGVATRDSKNIKINEKITGNPTAGHASKSSTTVIPSFIVNQHDRYGGFRRLRTLPKTRKMKAEDTSSTVPVSSILPSTKSSRRPVFIRSNKPKALPTTVKIEIPDPSPITKVPPSTTVTPAPRSSFDPLPSASNVLKPVLSGNPSQIFQGRLLDAYAEAGQSSTTIQLSRDLRQDSADVIGGTLVDAFTVDGTQLRSDSQSCDMAFSQRSFVIQSPNWPSTYPANMHCNFYISKNSPDVCKLRVKIETLNIIQTKTAESECGSDYLDISGYRFCGNIQNKTVNIAFTSNQTVIKFHSDDFSNANGFVATIEQLRNDCDERARKDISFDGCEITTREKTFSILSPGFPELYPNGLWCQVTVVKSTPKITRLRLRFDEFEVQHSTHCMNDYLVVSDKRYCGDLSGETYTLPFVNEITTITFSTDNSGSKKGYNIQVEQLTEESKDLPICGGVFKDSAFQLSSPNHPQDYPPDLRCLYKIIRTSSQICQLHVEVLSFNIEGSPACKGDYLRFDEHGKMCGRKRVTETRLYQFTKDHFWIEFVSDKFGAGSGFKLNIQQRVCNPILRSDNSPRPIPVEPVLKTSGDEEVISSSFQRGIPVPPPITLGGAQIVPLPPVVTTGTTNNSPIAWPTNCNWCKVISVNQPYIIQYSNAAGFNGSNRSLDEDLLMLFDSNTFRSALNSQAPITMSVENQEEQSSPQLMETKLPEQRSYTFKRISRIGPTSGTEIIRSHPTTVIENEQILSRPNNRKDQSNVPQFLWPHEYGSNLRSIHVRPSHDRHRKAIDGPRHILVPPPKHSFQPSPKYERPQGNVNSQNFPFTVADSKLRRLLQSRKRKNPFNYERSTSPTQSRNVNRPVIFGRSISSTQSGLFTKNRLLHDPLPIESHSATNTFVQEVPPPHFHGRPPSKTIKFPDDLSYSNAKSRGIRQILPNPTSPLESEMERRNILTSDNVIDNEIEKTGEIPSHDLLPPPLEAYETTVKNESIKNSSKQNRISSLELQQKEPDFGDSMKFCNKTLKHEQFKMKSPGYPGPFFVDMHCFYVIEKNNDNICGVLLTIDMMDLPGTAPCQKTYLSIAGRHFCGTHEKAMKTLVAFARSKPIVLEFRSDTFHSGAGFSLDVKQIQCNLTEEFLGRSFGSEDGGAVMNIPPLTPESPANSEPQHNWNSEPYHAVRTFFAPPGWSPQDNSGALKVTEIPWVGPGGRRGRGSRVSKIHLQNFKHHLEKLRN